MRRAQRDPQEIEGLVTVLIERTQRAVEVVARDLKTKLDGVVLQPLVVGVAVEVAGALVEQIGGEVGGARFVRLVLGGAAMEDKIRSEERRVGKERRSRW